MTQPASGPPPAVQTPTSESPTDPSLPQVARAETGAIGHSAADAGRQIADTAVDQAAEVGQEARRQAKDLFAQAREQATGQVRTGQQKAGESLQALASELRDMAGAGERSGVASDLAAQAAERLEGASHWLVEREPGDLVEEFRGFARRRPGAFLLGAAAAGLLVGRLTRGAIDANRDTGSSTTPGSPDVPPPTTTPPRAPEPHMNPYGGQSRPVGQSGSSPDPADADAEAQWTQPDRTPSHAARAGATTVGEYVEELERREPRIGPGGGR
ncbi:hypothetical protein [Pseudonocardia xishanensis]|uniref:Uncharacterized protein n=1 Tax=Pseudonocardia xishanensis TaxID=630995 RepID=A0ABP8RSS8_9PSEU